MERYTLKNRIAVNIIETDRFKTGMLSVNLIVPLEKQTAAVNTLLLRVLKQGSANYPSLAAINTRLDDLYATGIGTRNYKRGDLQILGFSADILNNAYIPDGTDVLGGAIDMLCELLLRPRLDENGMFFAQTVEREKESQCDAIRAQINSKQRYAFNRCIEIMCENERFGTSLAGTVDEVEAITPQLLTERYFALLREARVEIFFVGKTPASELLPRLEKSFGMIEASSPIMTKTEVIRHAQNVREITEIQQVEQGKLVLGFRSGYSVQDADYLDFMTFCELYGSSPTSKLFVNVREKLSLCYYCSAQMDSFKGLMYVTSGVAPENRDRAFNEIMAQLEAVRHGEFTEDELNNAIRSLQSGYRELTDSPGGVESYYLGRQLFGVDVTIEEMQDGFSHVTAEGVIAAANRVSLDTVYFLRGPDGMLTSEDEEVDETDE